MVWLTCSFERCCEHMWIHMLSQLLSHVAHTLHDDSAIGLRIANDKWHSLPPHSVPSSSKGGRGGLLKVFRNICVVSVNALPFCFKLSMSGYLRYLVCLFSKAHPWPTLGWTEVNICMKCFSGHLLYWQGVVDTFGFAPHLEKKTTSKH